MAGHPREDGKLVCEADDIETKDVESDIEQTPTPPQSPSPLPKQTPSPIFHRKESAPADPVKTEPQEVRMLPNGIMHWRNPNATFPRPYRPPPRQDSLQSTVLCDSEGKTIHVGGSERIVDNGEDDELPSSKLLLEIVERIGGYADPAVFTFSVHEQNIRMAQGFADISGLHSAIIANPRSSGASSESTTHGEEEGHFWLVVSRDQENLRHVINTRNSKMPGALPGNMPSIVEAEEWAKATEINTMPPAWRWLTSFLQIVIASMIGGLVVVWGLAVAVD
ncbi:hypothetical protein BDN71DRAFT_1443093 [Pleurotus eryngii]|uniref:Uncharacterized protein n=1 Tax=Pleurotus eryngii TaxID=5323 RepID=A0A9P6A2B1_PLEER|nr:hypothetical protein BDN71DRAFT_1443093 [Pleurotus eryngii]